MSSFQSIILKLQNFWAHHGCILSQSYDLEMGAGTSHPLTALRALGPKPWRTAYTQVCRRPADGRYGENPNRLSRFHQFQVLLKPAPDNCQELLLESYRMLGIDDKAHDIRFVEDDWENPSLGASGLGWEVWLDGMEVTQFTYFQQVGGLTCDVVSVELAYGLERLALFLTGKDSIFDLPWNDPSSPCPLTYGDVALAFEQQFCRFYFELSCIEEMWAHFHGFLKKGHSCIAQNLPLVAYDQCTQAGHLFNQLEARGALSVIQRAQCIQDIRTLARACCQAWLTMENTVL